MFCHRTNLLDGCRTKYVHQIFPRGLLPSVQQIDFPPPTHFQDHLRRIRVPTATVAQKKIAILLKPATACRHRSKHVVIGERKLAKTRAADAQRDRHALREFDLARLSLTRGGSDFSANTCHEYPGSSLSLHFAFFVTQMLFILQLFSHPPLPKPVAIFYLLPINLISIEFRIKINANNCIDVFYWRPIAMNLNEMQNRDRGCIQFSFGWNPNLRIGNQHTFSISQLNFPAYLADWEFTDRLNQSLEISNATSDQLQTLEKRCRNRTALKFRPYVNPSNIDHPRQSIRRDLSTIGSQIDVMHFIIHFLPRHMRNRLGTRSPEDTPHIWLQKIR